MTDSQDPDAELARLRSGLALVLATFGLTLVWWVPVARRITMDRHEDVTTIDAVTLPGLVFDPGADANASRVIAIVTVILSVVWALLLHRSLSRADITLSAWTKACAIVQGLVVLALLVAVADAREHVERPELDNLVETTSGWVVVALLPLMLSLAAERVLVPKSVDPAPRDNYAD